MSGIDDPARMVSEFYRSVFYRIENPTLIIGPEFVVRDANPAAATFLGCDDPDEVVGTHVQEIVVDEDVIAAVAERVSRDDRWTGEVRIRTFDSRIYFGKGSAVPVEADDGDQYIVGLFTDLTQRRRHTRSLKVLNRVLRHNIRNEVNVLLGHVELLREYVGAEGEESLDAMSETLRDLIDRADVARELETTIRGNDRDVLSSVDLTARLERAVRTAEATLDATFEYDPDGSVAVIADEAVGTMLDEVLENAVEHNDADRPRVRVTTTVDEDEAVVRVADNGPGVPPGDRDRIFGREEIDQTHHGQGFGLFFVDQVMMNYGGQIEVDESDLGGVEFRLRFPRAR